MATKHTNINFEDILPWGTTGGDTGLSARLKLKRNFDKIKAWIDALEDGLSPEDIDALIQQMRNMLFVDRGEWKAGQYYYCETLNGQTNVIETSRVWHNGVLWECLADGTTQEPAFACSDWEPVTGHKNKLQIDMTLGEWMALGETNLLTCRALFGEEDITGKVDSWEVTRDSGDPADDAVWNASAKAQAFDGRLALVYSNGTDNDLGADVPTTFTFKAKKDGQVVAEGEVTV